ncbi:FAD-binding protein [bacterium]|nr:FAD-binding protein [bacterium]
MQENQDTHELRLRLSSIIGADRWVPGPFPAVAPMNRNEISSLLKGYSDSIMVVGSGSSFTDDFNPGDETLILLTERVKDEFDISQGDQTIQVSAGWEIVEVNDKLAENSFIVPCLCRFDQGTIGGRLAGISSRPTLDMAEGWIHGLLGIEVVLPSGEMVLLGSHCIKDVAGYDLRHFFTGSRGTAGVIVSAIFRCRPRTKFFEYHGHAADYLNPGSFDAQWRRVFDPFGRMKHGH